MRRALPMVLIASSLIACGGLRSKAVTSATPAVDGPVTAEELSTGVAGAYVKKRLRLSSVGRRDAYALLFLAGDAGSTVTARPTVLQTLPYEGFDWSADPTDQSWSGHAGAAVGYAADDANSVGYSPGAGQVPYALKSEGDLYGDALYYLLHGMNVAFVFNRFYAGGTFVDHAYDTALTLRYLSGLPSVDADRLGVYGLSWGGMTAAYGVSLSGLRVKQLTLLSPALDLGGLVAHFNEWVPANVSSSSQRTAAADFFAPYGRRITSVMANVGALAAGIRALLTPTDLATRLADHAEHTLIFADDSDTLIDTARTRAIAAAMPSLSVTGLWWSHATPINYETAPLAHQTDSSYPLVFSNVMTMMYLDMAFRLLPPAQNIVVLLYDVNEWNRYLLYMRGEQTRGLDVSAFTRMLTQMADPRVTVQNQAIPAQTAPGADWISLWLQVHWGANIPAGQVLATLQSTGLPP